MTNYNFSELSDFEFEALCRDLLQEELSLSLELFAPGPDRGIDIRGITQKADEDFTIIAQCKRWAENSFASLLRHLSREELPKIKSLSPQRYILMTSVKLTPVRKDKIVTELKPWIQNPNDVMGRDDISGLLARYSEVERRHIKLWLTGNEVLGAMLNSDVFNRSEDALNRARQQLRLWVPNPSFDRAREIIEANHVCIISGPPGIGKTMLADILSASYVSQGYQLVAISDDIEEGDRAWEANDRQAFLYDDFLGHVTYGEIRLRKNEQSRLAQFLERVRRSERKRFILTTREYILSEASRRYERLSGPEFLAFKSIITLEDYNQSIRGRILYNHLFFSELPYELRTALLPKARYWDVIRHHNYNPRVISHALNMPGVTSLSPEDFVSRIFATLDDPAEVWEVIFENLPTMARRVLLAIASLPSEMFLDDLRRTVENLSPNDFDPSRFKNAIALVEGTFIHIKQASRKFSSRQRVVAIADPSVRDYLWARLEADGGEADRLLHKAIFFEQCIILYEGSNHVNSMRRVLSSRIPIQTRDRDVVNHEVVAGRAVDLLFSNSPVLRKWSIEGSESFEREPMSLELRAAFLMDILAIHHTSRIVTESAEAALIAIIEMWEEGQGSPVDGVELLDQLVESECPMLVGVLERAEVALFQLITNRLQEKEDFTALVGLADLRPQLFAKPRRTLISWSSEFEDFIRNEEAWLLEEIDDPYWLEEEISQLSQIASAMGTDITQLEDDAEGRKSELEIGLDMKADDYDYIPEFRSDHSEEGDMTEIDALFQSLG